MLHVVEQDCDGAMYRVSFLFIAINMLLMYDGEFEFGEQLDK
jgi:hypothetical protein